IGLALRIASRFEPNLLARKFLLQRFDDCDRVFRLSVTRPVRVHLALVVCKAANDSDLIDLFADRKGVVLILEKYERAFGGELSRVTIRLLEDLALLERLIGVRFIEQAGAELNSEDA